MIERQSINGKDVWLKIDPYRVQRSNPNIIPTEYFTASFYYEEPAFSGVQGEMLKEDDGAPKLFESPVAALNYARKRLEKEGHTPAG